MRKLVLLWILLWFAGTALAQQNAQQNGEQSSRPFSPGHALPSPTATAVRTDEPIVVDGQFDEAIWATAPVVDRLIQRDPHEGELATERTEIRILFDHLHLYLGVICHDSNPSGIVATELRRDDDMETDDIFEVIFDTFHDHRNGYRFRVNPLGTQPPLSPARSSKEFARWNSKVRSTISSIRTACSIPARRRLAFPPNGRAGIF